MVSPLIHYDDCYSPSECFGNANPFAGNLISSAQPVKVSFEGNGFEEDAAQGGKVYFYMKSIRMLFHLILLYVVLSLPLISTWR